MTTLQIVLSAASGLAALWLIVLIVLDRVPGRIPVFVYGIFGLWRLWRVDRRS